MATDERSALWAAIREHPDDDTPRLVYADWLQENGDEPRAEFIRVQCELEQIGSDRRRGRKRRPVLEAREKDLLARHRATWLAPFFQLFTEANTFVRPTWFNAENFESPFRRGFMMAHELTLEQARRLAEHTDSVEPVEWIYAIKGEGGPTEAALIELARWPGSNRVHQLHCVGATDESVAAVTDGGNFRSLSHLALTGGSISDTGAAALAGWPFANRLHVLCLNGNPITRTGADALIASPHLSSLNWLYLHRTHIDDEGQRRLRERFGYNVQVSS